MNHLTIPLVDPDLIAKLDQAIRAIDTKKARTIESVIDKQPYCNALTSIARLLSTREVCGCFHLTEKELLLSTNKEFDKGKCRKRIGEAIFQLVQNDFQEEDKLSLYQKCFKEVIKSQAKRYMIELCDIQSVQATIFNKNNWDTIALEEIHRVRESLQKFYKDNKSNPLLAQAAAQVLMPLEDIHTICEELPQSKQVLASITQAAVQNRYNTAQTLHCELAALERDNQTTDLKTLVAQLNQRIKNKDFTISKFCCYLCDLVFDSLSKCHTQNAPSNFSYLGNSGIFFPNWQAPYVKKDEYSMQVVAYIETRIKQLIDTIHQAEYAIKEPEMIENHPLAAKKPSVVVDTASLKEKGQITVAVRALSL